ncbi:uncharacterized protein LOC101848870 [Aplysia californica]|uniref:Uncharacterized protein LOC101848870 n=1 Tax=Aplysia californica TaxID=6500 RepID=A0ABM1AF78_APLCA|nr:uncharacterized protein LOC101848870 [Aplysia californica]
MAFRAVVAVTLVALVSAGMDANYMNMMNNVNMMNMMQNMGGMNMQQGGHNGGGGGGCNPATGGGCVIPQGVDVGAYLQQQKEQQQYESQQMAERIKAQFESVMKQVTMKKHRYAMSVMTEFTSMCACAQQSFTIYQTMFVENAKATNMTDVMDLNDWANKMPYEAASAKEARELIFGGMLNALCTALGEFMNFAQRVENNIPVFENNPVTAAPGAGK